MLADGIGGRPKGATASRIAASLALREMRKNRRSPDVRKTINAAVQTANAAILKHSDWISSRMGTTILIAMYHGRTLYLGYVGDTKAYLLRRNKLTKLTVEHTLANEMNLSQLRHYNEASSSLLRHILTQSLGHGEIVKPSIRKIRLKHKDVVILCTDGIDAIPNTEIQRLCVRSASISTLAKSLVQAARVAGGQDDVTVIATLFD